MHIILIYLQAALAAAQALVNCSGNSTAALALQPSNNSQGHDTQGI